MSTTDLTNQSDAGAGAIEKVLIGGDLAQLKTEERLSYYNRVCESLGLNPLTQPFAYLQLNGKLVLYARKDAAEQLRSVRSISLNIVSREMIDGMYVVTCAAATPSGRTDAATGVVDLSKLSGEAKANGMMKAETKAKRRVTLSICGLGLMDESEVDSVPHARKVSVEDAHSGRLLAAGKETQPSSRASSDPAKASAGTGTAPLDAPVDPKLDPRPIPEELRDAVSKLRVGDASVVKSCLADLKREMGNDALFDAETAKLRKQYPGVIPTEAMVGFWLDCWRLITVEKFVEEVNPA
jgi:hypothetical protein